MCIPLNVKIVNVFPRYIVGTISLQGIYCETRLNSGDDRKRSRGFVNSTCHRGTCGVLLLTVVKLT